MAGPPPRGPFLPRVGQLARERAGPQKLIAFFVGRCLEWPPLTAFRTGNRSEDVAPDMRPAVTLRTATLADVAILRWWDEQPHVIESDPNDEWNWEVELGRSVDWREQLMPEVDGRPIGFVQIIDPAREESHYWGEAPDNLRAIDIWIGEAADLGRGFGTQVMRQALARCFADARVTAVLVDPLASNVRSHRFYERQGFRFLDRRRFGADDCFVYSLSREDWKHA